MGAEGLSAPTSCRPTGVEPERSCGVTRPEQIIFSPYSLQGRQCKRLVGACSCTRSIVLCAMTKPHPACLSTQWMTIMEAVGNTVQRKPWNKGKIGRKKDQFSPRTSGRAEMIAEIQLQQAGRAPWTCARSLQSPGRSGCRYMILRRLCSNGNSEAPYI